MFYIYASQTSYDSMAISNLKIVCCHFLCGLFHCFNIFCLFFSVKETITSTAAEHENTKDTERDIFSKKTNKTRFVLYSTKSAS